jgi:hypothetical protein
MPPAFALSQDQTLRFIQVCALRTQTRRTAQLISRPLIPVRTDRDQTAARSVYCQRMKYRRQPPQAARRDISQVDKPQPRLGPSRSSPPFTETHEAEPHRAPSTYPFHQYLTIKEHPPSGPGHRSEQHTRRRRSNLRRVRTAIPRIGKSGIGDGGDGCRAPTQTYMGAGYRPSRLREAPRARYA